MLFENIEHVYINWFVGPLLIIKVSHFGEINGIWGAILPVYQTMWCLNVSSKVKFKFK